MDDKIQQICELVHDLVTNYPIQQDQVYSKITKYLVDKAGDRKQYILYNTCYGGFGLSDQFQKFAEVYDEREGMRDHVIEFGKEIAQQYPHLAKLVNYYLVHDMNMKTSMAMKYNYWSKQKHYLDTNMATIEEMAPNVPEFVTERYSYMFMYDSGYLKNVNDMFTTIDTKKTVSDIVRDLRDKSARCQKELDVLQPDIDENILAFLRLEQDNKSSDTKYSLIDALESFGEYDESIWTHQSLLNPKAMRFLTLNPPQDADADIDPMTYETLGLLGAAHKHACLRFAEVPVGLSYTIHEYDGKESVSVD